MPGKIKEDLTGKRFGKRVCTGMAPRDKSGRVRWYFRCDCGNTGDTLTQGFTRESKSGGCIKCNQPSERPWKRKRPFESAYNNFKNRARYEVCITYEDYLEIASNEPDCHYCGAKLVWNKHNAANGLADKRQSGSNLDRKDPAGPYSKDNVVACCGRCNYGKGTHFTYDEWVKIGEVIKTFSASELPLTPQNNFSQKKRK